MVLTTGEVFLIERNFRLHKSGRSDGPNLIQVTIKYRQKCNKAASCKSVIFAFVGTFRRIGSVLCQRKDSLDQLVQSSRRRLVITANKLNIRKRLHVVC